MLYKALNSDLKSQVDHHCGWTTGPWVGGEWLDIETEVWTDTLGHTLKTKHSGFFCSDDILWAMSPEFTRYIAEVEVDGTSVVLDKTQYWSKMRVVSIKAWPASNAALVLDWCENRANDYWESHFPSEATLYNARRYQGQHAQMVAIMEPLWHSLFLNGETISGLHRNKYHHPLKEEYSQSLEWTIRLAYITSLALNGDIVPYGGNLAWMAEFVRPGAWEIVRGFTADHWSTLPEV